MLDKKAPQGAAFFLPHRRRLAVGIEHLRINNIFLRDEVAMSNEFGNSFLMDLAGNAFETRSFLAVLITMLVTIAKCKSNSASIAVAYVSSASKFASLWDDSDDSSDSSRCSSSGN